MRTMIRHLAASPRGRWLAAGAFKHWISIWDLDRRHKVSSFETILDFGGRRLALDEDGQRCYAGAYTRYGIACYDVATGEVNWWRKDLKKVQDLVLSPDSQRLYCGFADGPAIALEAATGHEIFRHRGVRSIHESRFGEFLFYDKQVPELMTPGGKRIARLERESFAILAVQFGPDSLAISEAAGAVRFFSLDSGTEVARYSPQKGKHVIALGFSEAESIYFGIEWAYEYGSAATLVRFDPDGAAKKIALVGAGDIGEFVRCGNELVTPDGYVFAVATAEMIGRLEFPRRDGDDCPAADE